MTTNLLKSYFPMIQSREEILARIYSNPKLQQLFESWTVLQQKEFLDFCSGAARDVESLKGSTSCSAPSAIPRYCHESITLKFRIQPSYQFIGIR